MEREREEREGTRKEREKKEGKEKRLRHRGTPSHALVIEFGLCHRR